MAAGVAGGFPMTGTISDIATDTDDSDLDYEPNEETALETYSTPLDEEDCDVDEYIVFKEVMTRKSTAFIGQFDVLNVYVV